MPLKYAVMCFVLGMYSGLFVVLVISKIDLEMCKREVRRNKARRDADEQQRLKGIQEGTWQ